MTEKKYDLKKVCQEWIQNLTFKVNSITLIVQPISQFFLLS